MLSRCCSLRLLAVAKFSATTSVGEAGRPVSEWPQGFPTALRPTDHDSNMSMLRKEIVASLKYFVDETQRVFESRELTLHQHLVQAYREFGQQHVQIKRANSFLESHRQKNNQRISIDPKGGASVAEKPIRLRLKFDPTEEHEAEAIDIFFDCVSRFSMDDSCSSIDRLQKKFSGSSDYCFESFPSFFPEQYTTEGMFHNRVFAVAMKQSPVNNRTQQYFLTYAETPRRWQRVILSATFINIRKESAFALVAAPDKRDDCRKVLSRQLLHFFNRLLSRLDFFILLRTFPCP
jgi:hypothetical protein